MAQFWSIFGSNHSFDLRVTNTSDLRVMPPSDFYIIHTSQFCKGLLGVGHKIIEFGRFWPIFGSFFGVILEDF